MLTKKRGDFSSSSESKRSSATYSDDDSDIESREKRKRKRKRQQGCCGNATSQTWLLFGVFFGVMILAVLMIAIVVSVYGPVGQVQKTIATASTMVAKFNNSGVADIIVAFGSNWAANNMTVQTFELLDAIIDSGGRISQVILAIEPELVQQLANRTTITLNGLLSLAEGIITDRGLNIQIPL